MSESAPEQRGRGRGGGSGLTRKVGPLPLWGWAVTAAGATGAYLWWRNRKATSTGTATGASSSTGACVDSNGNPVDCGAAGAMTTDEFEALYTQGQGIESTLVNVAGNVQDLQSDVGEPGRKPPGHECPPGYHYMNPVDPRMGKGRCVPTGNPASPCPGDMYWDPDGNNGKGKCVPEPGGKKKPPPKKKHTTGPRGR